MRKLAEILLSAVVAALIVVLVVGPIVFAAAPATWTTPKTDWVSGDKVTSSQFNDIGNNISALGNGMNGTNYGCATADTTVNNSTVLVNIAGAAFAISPNEKWIFQAIIFGSASATADWDFAMNGPASPTLLRYHVTGQAPISTSSTAYLGRVSVGANGVTQANLYILSGYVQNGANSGNLQLRMSQNVATVADNIVYSMTCLYGWRVQ